MNPLSVDPPVCPITFECINVVGNYQSVNCNAELVYLDPLTGSVTFNTQRMATFPPGDYTFTMRGTTGLVDLISTDFTFTLTMTDPCPTSTLTNIAEFPFIDVRYTLGRPEIK